MNVRALTLDRFRPIQYLGNKTRLLEEIAEAMAAVIGPDERIADLFSGTAVVGRRLARRNPVIGVDVQGYAAVLGRAMLVAGARDLDEFDEQAFLARADEAAQSLTRSFAPLIGHEAEALVALAAGNPLPITALIEGGSPWRMAEDGNLCCLPLSVQLLLGTDASTMPDATAALAFGGVYFSYEQAIQLDALYHASTTEPGKRRDVLLAAILGTASEVVNTVGKQFAQPIRILDRRGRPKVLLIDRTLRDRSLDARVRFLDVLTRWRRALGDANLSNMMIQADVDGFLRSDHNWAAAYADPPYTIDHYSRFYHVLETLVRRDRPKLSRMQKKGVLTTMRGLYRDDRFQSDFCVPSRAPRAFGRLIEGVARRGAPLVLSYSGHDDAPGQRPRSMRVDDLVALARQSYRFVEVLEPKFEGHRKLNADHFNVSTQSGTERLILCRT